MLMIISALLGGLYVGFGLSYNCFLATCGDTFLGKIYPEDSGYLAVAVLISAFFWPFQMYIRHDQNGATFSQD